MKAASINALTGLRFFAAGMIVWLHLSFHPGVDMAHFTALGVSLFFVLSGFILAHNYRNMQPKDAGGFLVARLSKIFPLHLFSLLLIIALLPIFNHVDPGRLFSNLFLLQAWIPERAWAYSYNAVSWTLSNELFFYLCFPFIYLYFAKRIGTVFSAWIVLFIITCVLIAWVLPALEKPLEWKYVLHFNPVIRLGEFLAGIITYEKIYLRLRDKQLDWRLVSLLQLIILPAALVAVEYVHSLYGVFRGTPVEPLMHWLRLTGGIFPAVAVIGILSIRGAVSDLFSMQPFVILGEISFATYMLHHIILRVFRDVGLFEAPNHLFTIGLYLLVVYAASYFAWKFVEVPCQRFFRGCYRRSCSNSLARLQEFFHLSSTRDWMAVVMVILMCALFFLGPVREARFEPFASGKQSFANGYQLQLSDIRDCLTGICVNARWQVEGGRCDARLQRLIQVLDKHNKVVTRLRRELPPPRCGKRTSADLEFKEQIYIRGKEMTGVNRIRLALQDKETGMVPLEIMPSGMPWIDLWMRPNVFKKD